jgi:hypothetical protein
MDCAINALQSIGILSASEAKRIRQILGDRDTNTDAIAKIFNDWAVEHGEPYTFSLMPIDVHLLYNLIHNQLPNNHMMMLCAIHPLETGHMVLATRWKGTFGILDPQTPIPKIDSKRLPRKYDLPAIVPFLEEYVNSGYSFITLVREPMVMTQGGNKRKRMTSSTRLRRVSDTPAPKRKVVSPTRVFNKILDDTKFALLMPHEIAERIHHMGTDTSIRQLLGLPTHALPKDVTRRFNEAHAKLDPEKQYVYYADIRDRLVRLGKLGGV